MPYYTSSSYLDNYSYYFDSFGHSTNSGSTYNDAYRSYSNLRALPYQAPTFYKPEIPYSSIIKRPYTTLDKNEKTNSSSRINVSTTSGLPKSLSTTGSSSTPRPSFYSSTSRLNGYEEARRSTTPIPISTKRESSVENEHSLYSRSSTPNPNSTYKSESEYYSSRSSSREARNVIEPPISANSTVLIESNQYVNSRSSSRESRNADEIVATTSIRDTSIRDIRNNSNSLISPSSSSSFSYGKDKDISSNKNNNNDLREPTTNSLVTKTVGTNDLYATAVSSIQLNCTDDLMTQVDYYLNEIDNRMICRGKQIELESFELSCKGGLLSKCLYINELLKQAGLDESHFNVDPSFLQNGKAILVFNSAKDAEEFAKKHSDKFNVAYTNGEETEKQKSNIKKNVSFSENNDYSVDIATMNEDDLDDDFNRNKSILKNSNSNNNNVGRYSATTGYSPIRSKSNDAITSRTTININNPNSTSSISSSDSSTYNNNNNINSTDYIRNGSNRDHDNRANGGVGDASILVSTNSSKKKQAEGYEILTIRAKLKQRVGPNRAKQVELRDIDAIMRNVVTIIQDEFMKRFPSGPSPSEIRSN